MNQIQQTILSIDDIAEHHDDILKLDADYSHAQALFAAVGIYDDMLIRFAKTFLSEVGDIIVERLGR